MDTPLVNGTAYPYLEVEPKTYRFRVLNAANDRFFNLQLYVADPADDRPRTGRTQYRGQDGARGRGRPDSPKAGRRTDGRAACPIPAMAGPSFIQIGTEGGFLPAPVVIPNQPVSWNMNADHLQLRQRLGHALLLGPAERADVIVDFSAFRRQDPDPLQRRPRGLPGPRSALRLLHG